MEAKEDPRYIKLLRKLDVEVSNGLKLPWFDYNPETGIVSVCAYCIVQNDLKGRTSEELKQMMDDAYKANMRFNDIVESVGLQVSHSVCSNCTDKTSIAVGNRNRIMFKNILHLSDDEKQIVLSQLGEEFRTLRDTTPEPKDSPPEYDDEDIGAAIDEYQDRIEKRFGKMVIWDSILSPSEYYERHIDEYNQTYNEDFGSADFIGRYHTDMSNAINDVIDPPSSWNESLIKDPVYIRHNKDYFNKLDDFMGSIVPSAPLSIEDVKDDRPEVDSKPIQSKRLTDDEEYDPREDTLEVEEVWERGHI